MLRSLINEFKYALEDVDADAAPGSVTVATGKAAEPYLAELFASAKSKCPALSGEVVGVWNDFFGHTIDVAGLVTGQDLIAQLKKRDLGERVLIPANMLRHGGDVFLDDVTVEDVARELDRPVEVVEVDGYSLVDAIFEF